MGESGCESLIFIQIASKGANLRNDQLYMGIYATPFDCCGCEILETQRTSAVASTSAHGGLGCTPSTCQTGVVQCRSWSR